MSIKILTDSASDISREDAQKMGIEIAPLKISFGEEQYYDGVDLTPNEFYKKLVKSKSLPKTSQVTPYDFEQKFEQLTANGDEVIAIVLSSKLSGTCEAAKAAAERFAGKVHVFDSLNVAAGERIICNYALSLIEKGLSAKEVVAELEKIRDKVCITATLDTLEYLKKGGRISGASAIMGSILNIKPVAKLDDGVVKMMGKARGYKKAIALMNNAIKESGVDFDKPCGIIWTGLEPEIATAYLQNSKDLWGEHRVPTYIVGSTIGTHIGPGVVGVAYFKK
ncbi:MAG: DegV family protein [Clostridia bacterium]|nr:DegV family protein [Clostridia bacterium]